MDPKAAIRLHGDGQQCTGDLAGGGQGTGDELALRLGGRDGQRLFEGELYAAPAGLGLGLGLGRSRITGVGGDKICARGYLRQGVVSSLRSGVELGNMNCFLHCCSILPNARA
jgi:hypothetical protein